MKFTYLILLFLFVTSCVSKVDKMGYMFDLSDNKLLQEGVTSKERVLRIMGSPTLISDFDFDETWIYYSEDVKSFLFFKPDIMERTIVVINFSKSDTIKEIKTIDISDEAKQLDFVSKYTAISNHKNGFFKSIFSNVGQISAQ